jgi:hypothetical protein
MALGAIKKGARPWAEPLAESEPNNALEPTPSSVRCASASRRGSLPAFGYQKAQGKEAMLWGITSGKQPGRVRIGFNMS